MKTHYLLHSLALALLTHLSLLIFYPTQKPKAKAPPLQVFLQPLAPAPTAAVAPAPAPPLTKPSLPSPVRRPAATPTPINNTPTHSETVINEVDIALAPEQKLDLSLKPEASKHTDFRVQKNQALPNIKPQAETSRTALAKSLDKANKPDCKNAYSGLGPLAIVPLLANAVTDSGCQW